MPSFAISLIGLRVRLPCSRALCAPKDGLIPLPGATSQAGKMCDQARARAFARKKLAIFGYIKGYTGWYVDSRAETS